MAAADLNTLLASWAPLVGAGAAFAAGFARPLRERSGIRGALRGVAILLALRAVLFTNPWVWEFYGRVLDPEEVGWRQADVIALQRDARVSHGSRQSPRYLAVGSSQTGRIYRGYARDHEQLDVFTLSAMTPVDMVLYRDAILRREPQTVLLHLSDFDLAREPPHDALVMAPRAGFRLASIWSTMRAQPMGSSYDAVMAELLLGEFFPEAKYGFVLRGLLDKTMRRVAERLGAHGPAGDPISPEQKLVWLRESFDERFVALNLEFLRLFVSDMGDAGIDVAIVEGQYSPLVDTPATLRLAASVRSQLQELAAESDGVVYLAATELVELQEREFSDLTHVEEEVGYMFTEAVLSRLEHGAVRRDFNPAATPMSRDLSWWKDRHERLRQRVTESTDVDVIFVGDSITQGWEHEGQDAWTRLAGSRRLLNLGVGGDRTEHLAWRLREYELERLDPEWVVLLIGTNNCARPTQEAWQIAEGIEAVVDQLRERLPHARILLHALFPRGEPGNPAREKLLRVNEMLASSPEDPQVEKLDLGLHFLREDGRIDEGLMPDRLHLSPAGYELWAALLEQRLRRD